MNPLTFAGKAVDLSYKALNVASGAVYIIDSIKYKKILRRNKKFKNIHEGETCFILGNGPSINLLDVNELAGKDVFTVNGMVSAELYDILKPKYHCITDQKVLEKYNDKLNEKITLMNTEFFLHRNAYSQYGKYDNTYYTYTRKMPTGEHLPLDISKNSSAFINVVPYCIMIAIYMGYKKIILLGCDFSFFAARKNAHFYEQGKDIIREESMYQDLFGSSIACKQYAYLDQYAQKHGIKIINSTPESLLDVFPQMSIRDALKL